MFNLVVGLEMHGDVDAATASALDIAYRVGSRNYVLTTNNDIALVRHTCP
ncbi:MAG TPA: hypothetical protein VMP13_04705 [Acidimicrobiia bacterium]|nr:hypothetical protein [Acidimicrobiia bacterium]